MNPKDGETNLRRRWIVPGAARSARSAHAAAIVAFGIGLLTPAAAHATPQWSRKYGVSCTTCHTAAIPRLNYYGEKFQRNGYQDIGTRDGDTTGKQAIGKRLFIEDVGNFFGVRLNVVPVRVTTNRWS